MNDTTHDPAAGDYPTEVFAARLRWLAGRSDLEVWTEDWKAGELACAQIGVYVVAYGGDVAEEGAIGVTVWDEDREPVYLKGLTDLQGWIGADDWSDTSWTWDMVREAFRKIPGDVPFDGPI